MLKIERPQTKEFFFPPSTTFILLLKNPFNSPLRSFPEVRRERWPERGHPGALACVGRVSSVRQQTTNTSPWCHDEGDTAVLAGRNTLTEALRPLPGVAGCILLLQFKLQIHLKYISQECSQLKCKPCWAWKIFKKSWTLHLGGLHFHALKQGGRGPTRHRGRLQTGQPHTATDTRFVSKPTSHSPPNVFQYVSQPPMCFQRSEKRACSWAFLVGLIREKEQFPHWWLFKAQWYKYQPSVRPSALGCYIMHQGQATKRRQVASCGTICTARERSKPSQGRCYQRCILRGDVRAFIYKWGHLLEAQNTITWALYNASRSCNAPGLPPDLIAAAAKPERRCNSCRLTGAFSNRVFISELRLQWDRCDCRGKHVWNNQPSVIVWQLLLHQLWVVCFVFLFFFLLLHFTTLTSVHRRLQRWNAMRCRDLFFILSWKYKDKQSNTSEENDSTGGVIADRAPRPHKTENKK